MLRTLCVHKYGASNTNWGGMGGLKACWVRLEKRFSGREEAGVVGFVWIEYDEYSLCFAFLVRSGILCLGSLLVREKHGKSRGLQGREACRDKDA